jgi:hypothetical protein
MQIKPYGQIYKVFLKILFYFENLFLTIFFERVKQWERVPLQFYISERAKYKEFTNGKLPEIKKN